MTNDNNQDRNKMNQTQNNKDSNLIDSDTPNKNQTTGQRESDAKDMNDTDES